MSRRVKQTAETASFLSTLLIFVSLALAQTAPDCPLWGPVYPRPIGETLNSTTISNAALSLKDVLDSVTGNASEVSYNTSFHLSVFSTDRVLFEYNYLYPGMNNSLTSGVLNRHTIFRMGSVSKLLTVYALLAATGTTHLDDPVTKWVPELAAARFESNLTTTPWQHVSLKALAAHLAGVTKDCK